MQTYHSSKYYEKTFPRSADNPFIQEYRAPSTADFVPYERCEGDDLIPSNTTPDVGGYRWIIGFRMGINEQARAFIAPEDGLISIDFLDGIYYWLADKEASGFQLTHNGEVLFPAPDTYPDDFYPLSTEEYPHVPKLYRTVKKGDVLRFAVKSFVPDNKDDVVCAQEIKYLFGGALLHRLTVAPGERIAIPFYTTEGAVRFVSRDPETATVLADGTVCAHAEGSALIQLFFKDGSEDLVEVLVASDPSLAENPYRLTVERSSAARSPAAGLGVSEEDTLELCARLGSAVTSHGDRICNAVREDRVGDSVKLLANGALCDTVDATFLDCYCGGRTLKQLSLVMSVANDKNYHVRLSYSTVAEPTHFRYLITLQNPLPIPAGRMPILRLTPTDRALTDVYTVRAEFLRTDGEGISLCEIDVDLADESEDVLALRRELRRSFWLPEIFADNMMLQREKPIRIFGYSKTEGAEISVSLTDAQGRTEAVSATVENGKFTATLSPRKATTEGLTLTVSAFGQTNTYQNIWVGDIWVAAGQSNMGISAGWIQKQGYAEEYAAMESRIDEAQPIRMFTILPQAGDRPCRNTVGGRWLENTKENALSCTAVGYYSVRLMQEKTGVPMAVLNNSLAGTWVQSWVDEAFFDGSEPTDRLYLNWYRREQLAREGWCRPLAPYHGMAAPLAGFSVKGVLWYQGGNNAGQHWKFDNYRRQLAKFIAFWRHLFCDEELPFVVIQMLSVLCYSVPNLPKLTGGLDNPAAVTDLAMLYAAAKPKVPSENMYGYVSIREAQSFVEANDKNVLTVVAYDLSDKTHDVHPPNKLPLAERCGAQMLGFAYECEGLCHSPTFRSLTRTDDGLYLTFDRAEGGLTVSDGKPIRHFEVSDDGISFRDVEAILYKDGVLLKDKAARYVRHAFESCPTVNLYNREGYPLEPFRAGVDEGRIWEGDFTPRISE